MSHDHHHHSSGSNLKVAFFLNFAFTLIEIAGGIWTNSIAILSDAVHDAGDTASLGLAWYFDRMSERERTPQQTFGFLRYRLLGGLITGLVLIAGICFVLFSAVGRIMNPEAVNAPGMMALALVGIAFNGAAVLRVRKGTSMTEKLVSWHLVEDVLGWVAVLIGAGVMAIWDLPIIDPLLSIGISVFILWNVVRNLRSVVKVFLQDTPGSFDLEKFEETVHSFPGVLGSHHLHVWSLDGETHVLTMHVVVGTESTRESIRETKGRIRGLLDEKDFIHVTIDMEMEGEKCMSVESAHGHCDH